MPWKGTVSLSRRTKKLTRTSWKRATTHAWNTSSHFSGKLSNGDPNRCWKQKTCQWRILQPCSMPRQSGVSPCYKVPTFCWTYSFDNFSFQTAGWQPVEEISSRHDQPHGLDCQVTFCNMHLIIQFSSQSSSMKRGNSVNSAKDIHLCIYLSIYAISVQIWNQVTSETNSKPLPACKTTHNQYWNLVGHFSTTTCNLYQEVVFNKDLLWIFNMAKVCSTNVKDLP